MANLVEIKIVVDNSQATQAMATTQAALKGVGIAGQTSMQQLAGGTQVAVSGINNVSSASRTMNGHLASSLDGVRLLSQEFGLRLPRALESMISRVPAATAAISGLMGAFAGIAIAEVLFRAGEGLYNLYQKYVSVTAVVKAYNAEVKKAKEADFTNPHSIEELTARYNEATAAAKKYAEQANNPNLARDLVLAGKGVHPFAQHDAMQESVKAQAQAAALSAKQIADQHEMYLLAIEQTHAQDGALQGMKKINAEAQKKLDIDKENRRFTQEQDSLLQNGGRISSGASKQSAEDAIVRGQAAAQRIELEREIANKTISLQNEATNAGIEGVALLLAKKQQAEDEVRRSGIGTVAEIDAIELRFHNEQMKRLQEEADAVAKRARAEQEASLTGIALIQAKAQDRLNEINQRESKGLYGDQTGPGQHSALADQDRATAAAQTLREMGEAEKQYRQQQQELNDRSDDLQISAFAKIDQALQTSLDKRADAFEKMYGQLDHQSAAYVGAQNDLAVAVRQDTDAADRQRAQVNQQVNDQTLSMDKQAAEAERRVRQQGLLGWVADYKASLAAVQASHTEAYAKIDAEQKKTGGDPNQYQQQKVDADRIANAQILQADQQLRNQLASTLEGAFSDPVHTIQRLMQKMMAEILADWLLQSKAFGGLFGRTLGTHTQGGGGFSISGLGAGSSSTSASVGGGYASSVPGTSSGGFSISGLGAGSSSTGSSVGGGYASSVPGASSGGSGIAGLSSAVTSTTGADTSSYSSSDPTSAAYHGGLGLATGSSSSLSSLLTPANIATAGAGAYAGVTGLVSTFESSGTGQGGSRIGNGISSTVNGAVQGAELGMFAGPIGIGIGAAGGAAVGLIGSITGEGGNLAGEAYYKQTTKPQLEAIEAAYANGTGGNTQSSLSQANQVAAQALNHMKLTFGAGVAAHINAAYLSKEINKVTQDIEKLGRGGHDYGAASAAQFHDGGVIRGFGSFGTSGDEGFIHAQMGETVINRADSLEHAPLLNAIGSGASPAELAARYLTTGSSGTTGSGGGGGDTHHHWNVSTMDASSFQRFLRSGGASVINKELNHYTNQYAGDAA